MQPVSFKRHRFPPDAILKFGRVFAQNLRRSRPKPTGRWHLDEMAVKIRGERMWLMIEMLDQNIHGQCKHLPPNEFVHVLGFEHDGCHGCSIGFADLMPSIAR